MLKCSCYLLQRVMNAQMLMLPATTCHECSNAHVTCCRTCLCHRTRAPRVRYPWSPASCLQTRCRVSNCRSHHFGKTSCPCVHLQITNHISPYEPVLPIIISTLIKYLRVYPKGKNIIQFLKTLPNSRHTSSPYSAYTQVCH